MGRQQVPENDDNTKDREDSDTSTGADLDSGGNPADEPLPEQQDPAEEGALPEELVLPESQADRLASAVNDVQLLIRHAAGAGKEVPKGLIETISKAARDFNKTDFDAAREAEFWDAVAKITLSFPFIHPSEEVMLPGEYIHDAGRQHV